MNLQSRIVPMGVSAQIESLLRSSLSSSIADASLHTTFQQLQQYYIYQNQRLVELARASEDESQTIQELMAQSSKLQAQLERAEQANLSYQVRLSQAVDQDVLLRHKQSILNLERIRQQQTLEIGDLKQKLISASNAEFEIPKLMELLKSMKEKIEYISKMNKDLEAENQRLTNENERIGGKSELNYSILNQFLGEDDNRMLEGAHGLASLFELDVADGDLFDSLRARCKALLLEVENAEILNSELKRQLNDSATAGCKAEIEIKSQAAEIERLKEQLGKREFAEIPPANDLADDFDEPQSECASSVFSLTQVVQPPKAPNCAYSAIYYEYVGNHVELSQQSSGNDGAVNKAEKQELSAPASVPPQESCQMPQQQRSNAVERPLVAIAPLRFELNHAGFQNSESDNNRDSARRQFEYSISSQIEYCARGVSMNGTPEAVRQEEREMRPDEGREKDAPQPVKGEVPAPFSQTVESSVAYMGEQPRSAGNRDERPQTSLQAAIGREFEDFIGTLEESNREKTPEVFDFEAEQVELPKFDLEFDEHDSDIEF